VFIAHLSDPHISSGVLGARPAWSLYQTLGRVLALDPQPDCVVITGDLINSSRPEEYDVLREVIDRFPLPLHLVTGNHDHRDGLLERFAGTGYLGGGDQTFYAVEYSGVTVVALDSLVAGSPAGRLGERQLAWLDDVLAARPDVPALVCLHHPPIALRIPDLDAIRLEDGEALEQVLLRHRHVARVLAGHLHRVALADFAGTTLAVAGSTYRQTNLSMRPGEPAHTVMEPTGFLLHVLDNGRCLTHVVPVSHTAASVGGF
jgi:3',5'-cyclic AMP phosphodiesterase CpdA